MRGQRDTFGNKSEVVAYELPPLLQLHCLSDGDHDFNPRKASGRTERRNWAGRGGSGEVRPSDAEPHLVVRRDGTATTTITEAVCNMAALKLVSGRCVRHDDQRLPPTSRYRFTTVFRKAISRDYRDCPRESDIV